MSGTTTNSAPTVRDVAALAGVSPMTVSRTMAGGRNVRPEVQDRVRAAVEKLGYRPNQSARNTRLRKPTGLIGVAVTNLANPYYGQFALGVEEVAAAYGRQIVMGTSGGDPGKEDRLLAEFADRQLEGVILVPAGRDLAAQSVPGARALPGAGALPVVLATRTVGNTEYDAALVDDVNGAAAGTAVLLAQGHRRIGFIGDLAGTSTAQRRYEGFRQALEDAGTAFDEGLLAAVRDTALAAAAVHRQLACRQPPTAFFSANNRTTVGALRAICEWRTEGHDAGVPALASFDDVELADLLGIPLTVMSHDPRRLGAAAARMLFERLEGKAGPEPRVVQLPVSVHSY
ncbi:LacI family DNA-binding transcriptional regulator [Pseudarthrobacter sp. NPDC092424]|uniref:LacI family DNA-binding transcriptional regulator n=1 Tax=Pseudarthrobacter sp. NPDC092424 TaxID=3364415 RepID=UPI00381FE382